MKKALHIATALVLCAGVASAVSTDPIDVGLFDTGVDHSGALLAPQEADPHFLLKNPNNLGVTPLADSERHPLWVVPDPADHQWISPDGLHNNELPGEWIYTTTFNLASTSILSTDVLIGRWSADEWGEIYLNTDPTPVAAIDAGFNTYDRYHDFAITGFAPGVNTLTFKVTNKPGGNTPSGLLVDFTIPEPTSMALLVVMSGGLLFCRRNFKP